MEVRRFYRRLLRTAKVSCGGVHSLDYKTIRAIVRLCCLKRNIRSFSPFQGQLTIDFVRSETRFVRQLCQIQRDSVVRRRHPSSSHRIPTTTTTSQTTIEERVLRPNLNRILIDLKRESGGGLDLRYDTVEGGE